MAPGQVVLSSEGKEVGKVKEVRGSDFFLDRPVAPDIYVPYTAIDRTEADTIVLSITVAQVDDLGWADTGDENTTTVRAGEDRSMETQVNATPLDPPRQDWALGRE